MVSRLISGVADHLVKASESWMHHIERQYARPVPITTFYINLNPSVASSGAWGRPRVDARMRGDMIGGSIRNGEEVSLQGHQVNGILQVEGGKNFTTGATIVIQAPWTI